jgi:hypothetical protein
VVEAHHMGASRPGVGWRDHVQVEKRCPTRDDKGRMSSRLTVD